MNERKDCIAQICLDGRHVFMGYLNDEVKTREVFDEEFWLRSGDLGSQDDEGFITITGRIKGSNLNLTIKIITLYILQ